MLPEYEVVMQMEGAGPITGPALMAEIGDVRRFKNKKALVAFAGIDAPPSQSGAFESKSRHVSKRGSPHLRRTIFIVSNIILTRSNPENTVYCFMDKKRSEGKHYYVYTVAGSAKFLRVYYARVTEFLRSQPSPDACWWFLMNHYDDFQPTSCAVGLLKLPDAQLHPAINFWWFFCSGYWRSLAGLRVLWSLSTCFPNLKIILQIRPSVFKFNLKRTVIFCSGSFRVCNRSKQGELVPPRNFRIRFYKSSFKTLVGLRPNPMFSTRMR